MNEARIANNLTQYKEENMLKTTTVGSYPRKRQTKIR